MTGRRSSCSRQLVIAVALVVLFLVCVTMAIYAALLLPAPFHIVVPIGLLIFFMTMHSISREELWYDD